MSTEIVWSKIDPGLAMIFANFRCVRQLGTDSVRPLPEVELGRVSVELYYVGTLGAAEQQGFQTEYDDGAGYAAGVLELENLEAIAACDDVVTLYSGAKARPRLDSSVPSIKGDKVRTLGSAPAYQFTGSTGAGVLIGIIDSGVDINHPFLWKTSSPVDTRVVRIWDQGLVAQTGETPPDQMLLDRVSALKGSYGVEYTREQINDFLNKVPKAIPVRHEDCSGHGTHVASVAAGDGSPKYKYIGVAPRADLIVVKHVLLQTEPTSNKSLVSQARMFKDAVTYIRKIATRMGSAVVINCSLGTHIGARDGFDEVADWLRTTFDDSVSTGKICVHAVGNSAGNGKHATITFNAAGSIDLDLTIFDTRSSFTYMKCGVPTDNTEDLVVELWYPAGNATLTVDWVRPPSIPLNFFCGAALNSGPLISYGFQPARNISVTNATSVGTEGGAARSRNYVQIVLWKPTPPDMHDVGTCTVRLTASGPMTIHGWAYQPSNQQGVKFASGNPQVAVVDNYEVESRAAVANVIAVAAYDDTAPKWPTAKFSSRGPVPRHGVGNAPPQKPDLGAPGVSITAARGKYYRPMLPLKTVTENGTSCAAPHVAGVVALMLQKKPTLKPSRALALLQGYAQTQDPLPADEMGMGRVDVEEVLKHV